MSCWVLTGCILLTLNKRAQQIGSACAASQLCRYIQTACLHAPQHNKAVNVPPLVAGAIQYALLYDALCLPEVISMLHKLVRVRVAHKVL